MICVYTFLFVKKAITKVASMFNPVGAVIQAIIMVYDTIKFFIERFQQIAELANAVFESVANIAAGKIEAAASYVEKTMARTIPVIIGFLASLIGLGGISQKIKDIIKTIQDKVEAALSKLVNFIVGKVKGLLAKGKEAVVGIIDWWKAKKKFKAENEETHTLYFAGEGASAKLMIASLEESYTDFINKIDVKDKTDKQKVAKAKALEIAKKIDALRNKDPKTGMQREEIIDYLNDLAEQTSILSAGADPLPPSVIEYGTLTEEGGGTFMHANILSNVGVKGTPPTDEPPIWRKVNKRKGVYVQGHLLNMLLGGPGRAYNLTPITRRANSLHLNYAEREIKKTVFSNQVVEYLVDVVYKKHPERNFQKELENKKVKTQKEQEKLELMKYEQNNLAKALEIKWATLKLKGKKWEKDKEYSLTPVPNELPGDFQMED